MRTPTRSHRGFVLPVILALIMILLVVGFAMAAVHMGTLRQSSMTWLEKQALYAAEAGVQDVAARLKADFTYNTNLSNQTLSGIAAVTYSVTVTNNVSSTTTTTAPDGTQVPPGCAWVVGVGSAGGSRQTVSRTVRALMLNGNSPWTQALFGSQSLTLKGNVGVDAWNSITGAYDGNANDLNNNTVVNGAPVGTNDNSIRMNGSTLVNGNVEVGPGSNLANAVQGGGAYTGTLSAMSTARTPLTLSPPTGTVNNTDLSKIKKDTTIAPGIYSSNVGVSGNGTTLHLTSGTYYFKGDVNVTSGGVISADATSGPVIVYVEGNWDSTGGSMVNSTLVNGTPLPSNFQLYFLPTTSTVKITGGSGAYFSLYAWSADVTISGNADIYGAVLGRNTTVLGNMDLHFDTRLGHLLAPGTSPILTIGAVQRL